MSDTDTTSPDGGTPDRGRLYQAALAYLARYASTEAGLRRVLMRRIDRWASTQADREAAEPTIEAARNATEDVIRELLDAGSVSDDTFAQNRARTLVRAGQSTRSVQARLLAKGVAADVARAASETDPDTELAAALVLVRRRRIGAYRAEAEAEAPVRMRELALLARAGFSRDTAQRALDTPREEAESRIFELRR